MSLPQPGARARVFSVLLPLLVFASTAGAQERADSTVTLRDRLDRAVPVTPTVSAPARTVGADVFTIDSTSLTIAHPRTFSELLSARIPGVRVLRRGGGAEDGSDISFRGITSLYGDPAPLVVVDGIRVEAPEALGIANFARSSRLDDLAPEEIERVDVLRGAAASALYGTGSGRGVLVITTKRGRAGAPRLEAWGDAGISSDVASYPANFRRLGTDPATGAAVTCDIDAGSRGMCVPGALEVWNPLEQASPFRTGHSGAGGVSVSGGPVGIRGYASVGARRESGVLDDDATRLNARVNAERELFGRLTIGGSLGWVRRDATLSTRHVLQRAIAGQAVPGSNLGYRPVLSDSTPIGRSGDRLTRSVRLAWQALPWLRLAGVTGRDETTQEDGIHSSGGGVFLPYDEVIADRSGWSTTHLSGEATYAWHGIDFRSVLAHEESRRVRVNRDSLSANGLTSISETARWKALRSWTVQQRLGIGNVFFANLGARWVAKVRGREGRFYPAADVSWTALTTPSGRTLRLRGAYAEAVQEDPAMEYFTVPPIGSTAVPVEYERSREAELGADLSLGSRTRFGLTAFRQWTPNLHVLSPSAPGPGYPLLVSTPGRIENRGIELTADTRLLERAALRWDATLSFAAMRNRLTKLPTPPVVNEHFFIMEGEPVGTLRSAPVTWVDASGDALPSRDEITVGDYVPVGTSTPTRQAALRTEVTLPRAGLTFGIALDHRGGHRVVNEVAELQCTVASNCAALHDPAVRREEQVRAVAARYVADNQYHESATYTRLAEAAIRWRLPARVATLTGAGATLSLEARNLATWTGFGGLDPEVSTARVLPLPGIAFGQPLPRVFSLRLDVGPSGSSR